MMQKPVQAGSTANSIPQHVLDRLESEWKQIRESSARQPNQR